MLTVVLPLMLRPLQTVVVLTCCIGSSPESADRAVPQANAFVRPAHAAIEAVQQPEHATVTQLAVFEEDTDDERDSTEEDGWLPTAGAAAFTTSLHVDWLRPTARKLRALVSESHFARGPPALA